MQKLEKIIISCLRQIVASVEFRRLERTDETARLICAAARQIVQRPTKRSSECLANEGEVDMKIVDKVIKKYKINPNKPNPIKS